MTLLTALAVPVPLAAQEQPEGVTGANAGTANALPLINQPLVPGARKSGGSGFTLTVNGTGFVAGSAVNWNGSPRVTRFVSRSKLTASILASDIAKSNTASVTVVNPSPGGGRSNPGYFEVTTPTSAIFLNRSDYGTGSGPQHITTADFNQDGKLDLVVANFGSNTVCVLLGNSDGTFQPQVSFGVGSGPIAVAVGDFNGDGKLDLAVANYDGNTTSPPFMRAGEQADWLTNVALSK